MLLINAATMRTGGGLTILKNFLSHLDLYLSVEDSPQIIVLVPYLDLDWAQRYPQLKIISVPSFLSSSVGSLVLTFILPFWINFHKVNSILNFGDLPIPSRATQAMVVDWPYALYPQSPAWRKLTFTSYLTKRLKLFLFKLLVRYVNIFLPQTKSSQRRLNQLYNIKQSIVIPNALASRSDSRGLEISLSKAPKNLKFYYLTYYYAHKNIENLIYAVNLIRDKFDFELVLTLDPNLKGSIKISKIISDLSLHGIVKNIGPIEYSELEDFYNKVDVLVMPSLLESFSSSYIEAFQYNKAVVTSDLEFAHSVCGDAALYVDPLDPRDIANGLEKILSSPCLRQELVLKGRRRLINMSDWHQVFHEYMKVIREISVI